MKLKKLVSLLLVGAMGASMLVGCGSQEGTEKADEDTLVIWTLAKDLQQFADKYTEETGVKTDVVVIAPEDYPTKVQTSIGGQDEDGPDIIVAEPQMLQDFYDNGFFMDLDELGAKDHEGEIVDYVWEMGQDSDGVQRAISYQITPAGIYYRRDIAQEVFGTDDPEEIGKYFADYKTIETTAQTLKDNGYRIFASDSEISYFSGDSAWVIDGKLNVDQGRLDYMDLVVDLYQNDYTAYCNQWSTPWYQAMSGEVPILTAEIQDYADDSVNVWDEDEFAEQTKDLPKTEIFAYGLPAWGVVTMRDNYGSTEGKWGVCAGPSYGFGGGTFIGISSLSDKAEEAYKFIEYCTLNEDTADWWIEASKGDTVSLISALNKHADDENATYGGEKMYKFWMEQAEGIDYSKVTKYDKVIGDHWGNAIGKVKKGEMTKEEAIEEFYSKVQSDLPDIVVEK